MREGGFAPLGVRHAPDRERALVGPPVVDLWIAIVEEEERDQPGARSRDAPRAGTVECPVVMKHAHAPISTVGRHYSGVLVVAPADGLQALVPEIEAIPGVEVRHRHDESGRIVAVIESEDVTGQEATLLRIRSLPGVLFAALVVHVVDA